MAHVEEATSSLVGLVRPPRHLWRSAFRAAFRLPADFRALASRRRNRRRGAHFPPTSPKSLWLTRVAEAACLAQFATAQPTRSSSGSIEHGQQPRSRRSAPHDGQAQPQKPTETALAMVKKYLLILRKKTKGKLLREKTEGGMLQWTDF